MTELTSWMLGFGDVLSATGPLVVGGLCDLTGAFVLPMASLAVLGTFSGVLAMAPGLRRREVVPPAAGEVPVRAFRVRSRPPHA